MTSSTSPEDFVYTLIANSLVNSRALTDSTVITYGDWEYGTKYGPYVEVKWNQTYPFNLHMQPDTYWQTNSYSYYRGLPPVGCVNIAMAQILATVEHPSRASGLYTDYSWGELRTISNYRNLTDYLPGEYPYIFNSNQILMSKVNHLADFLYAISEFNHSSTSSDGTGSNIDYALDTFKFLDEDYFANAQIRSYASNQAASLNCIREGKPVFFSGFYTESDYGHAWVVDGYLTRNRRVVVTRFDSNGESQSEIHYQGSHLYHVNWGYSGQYDGYYNTGVFDMSRRITWDDVIDTNPYIENGNDGYDLDIMYISY